MIHGGRVRNVWQFWQRMSTEQQAVLRALAQGGTLKAHRTMDGAKVYRLHPLNEDVFEVSEAVVRALKRRKFIDSNMKFPAATYLLTDQGRCVLQQLVNTDALPLSAHNYHRE